MYKETRKQRNNETNKQRNNTRLTQKNKEPNNKISK